MKDPASESSCPLESLESNKTEEGSDAVVAAAMLLRIMANTPV
jgi:hypothetical protein